MFSVEDRERIREMLVARARSDSRLVAAAAIGASAGGGDRWSDLDLTFCVADEVPVEEVLTDWTQVLTEEWNAAVLFDLPVRSTIYRVFLLPGMLQVDLSFTPAQEFGALGPRFHLLFGGRVSVPSCLHRRRSISSVSGSTTPCVGTFALSAAAYGRRSTGYMGHATRRCPSRAAAVGWRRAMDGGSTVCHARCSTPLKARW